MKQHGVSVALVQEQLAMKPTTKKSIIKYILFVDVFKSIINKYL